MSYVRWFAPSAAETISLPRYRTSGDSTPPDQANFQRMTYGQNAAAIRSCSGCGLRRDDELLVQNDAHLAAEQFKENSDAFAIAEPSNRPRQSLEHAFAHAHFIAGRELRPAFELNVALLRFRGSSGPSMIAPSIAAGTRRCRPGARRRRSIELTRHRWIDGIESHEQVGWIERRGHDIGPARMTTAPEIAR